MPELATLLNFLLIFFVDGKNNIMTGADIILLRSQHGRVPLSLILNGNLSAIDGSLDSGTQLNQNAQHLSPLD